MTPRFAPEGDVAVSELTLGDFVEIIPSFVTRGPRGGLKRYRPTWVRSAVVEMKETEPGWYHLRFMAHRGVMVVLPADHKVRARVQQ